MNDCLVIGAGLIGLLTARELQQSGLKVTLLERGAVGRESSWAGGGILSPLYPWHYPQAVVALARWSQQTYPRLTAALLRETGIDPQWTQSGLLILDTAEQTEALGWARDSEVALELIGRETVMRLEPGLEDPPDAALWMSQVAQVRNPRLVRALKQSLLGRGVPILENTEVTGFVGERDRIVGVETSAGERCAEAIVVASGAWTGQLLQTLGMNLLIEPVRGQMILFRATPGTVSRILLHRDHYVIPRRDGRILVGSTMEHVGFDKSTTPEARIALRAAAVTLVPALASYPIEQHWTGLRPGTPTGIPFIGKCDGMDGLYINAGHFRNGVVTGPASARLLTDIILDRPPILPSQPYSLPPP